MLVRIMKRTIPILLASLILVFNSCQNEKNKLKRINSNFSFTIKGNVKNGNGIVLSLYIPSQGLDNRLKSTVKDGKYIFNGKTKYIEKAKIRFEENIIDESSSYSYIPIFIEPGKTNLDFTILGDSLQHYVENKIVSQGENNKFYYDVSPLFWKAYSTTIFSDSVKYDSMHQFVYPRVRYNTLKVYDSLLSNTNYPIVSIDYLNTILKDFGPFQFDKLEEYEKEAIVGYFNKIDTSLTKNPNYKKVKKKIEILRSITEKTSFKDFTLINIDDKEVQISDILKDNEITLIDFWWSGCGPCRAFNLKTSEIYDSLKIAGIEIISINVDESKKIWKKSSQKDKIKWINLYAGAGSDIELEYNIKYFPTKIVLDKDFNIIDFEFTYATELLNLIEK